MVGRLQTRLEPPGWWWGWVRSTERQNQIPIRKLNPLWWAKNTDSPLPEWWLPDEADMAKRRRLWYLRNPMHNFTHYVLGVADRHFHREGTRAADVWNPGGGANFAVIRC